MPRAARRHRTDGWHADPPVRPVGRGSSSAYHRRVQRRLIPPLAGVLALLCAVPVAVGARGVTVGPGAVPPDAAKRLGMLCRADTPYFRLWWSDTPGAAGAVAGADGSCASVPPVVTALGEVAESSNALAVRLGFPEMIGDAPPRLVRNPQLTRTLLRSAPVARVAVLRGFPSATRGSYLAGLPAATRSRVLRGVPAAFGRRFVAEATRALRGRPVDFVGGDRRVDVIIDGSGASGMVRELQPGAAPCALRGTGPRATRREFLNASVVVLASGTEAPRATLAHELFHVVQCNMAATGGAPQLVLEGTAEWFAARAEPVDFAPPAVRDGNTVQVRGGNSRVIGFCNRFDPAAVTGLEIYNSWGVWQALDGGAARPARVIALLRSFVGGGTRPAASVGVTRVGAARWIAALRVAAQSLCGSLTSPYGTATFAPEVRSFIGASGPAAGAGAPGSVNVPQWGVASVVASWAQTGAATVTVRLVSPEADAATLAASVVATTSAGPLAAVVRDGVATIDIPSAAMADRAVTLTVVNPRAAGALNATVTVEAAPTG